MARITCGCGECEKCKRRVYMRSYYLRPGVAEKARQRALDYRERNLEKVREYDRSRGFRELNKMKTHARNATRKLTRHPCERCGSFPADAHHEDYSRPLDVVWLCEPCHGLEHRKVA